MAVTVVAMEDTVMDMAMALGMVMDMAMVTDMEDMDMEAMEDTDMKDTDTVAMEDTDMEDMENATSAALNTSLLTALPMLLQSTLPPRCMLLPQSTSLPPTSLTTLPRCMI